MAPWLGYVVSGAAGVAGLAGLAAAQDTVTGSVAVTFVAGRAVPLTRTIGVISVDRQTRAGASDDTSFSLRALVRHSARLSRALRRRQ